MGSGGVARTLSCTGPTCAFVAGEEMVELDAHTIHILAMCDALTTMGADTELLAYPPRGGETPGALELRQLYGLNNTPRISWIPSDTNRLVRYLRLIIESSRASRRCTYAYTTRALPALGALLGGAPDVFLEFHQLMAARNDRVAFSLARHSKRLHVVCVSRRLAEMVAKRHRLVESAIIVEHNGGSVPIRDDYRAHSADGRRLRATYVGTLAPGRGLETIFAVAERHPAIDFIIVGPGQAPQGCPPSNVSLREPIPHAEVQALLEESDILLMPYTRHAELPDGYGGTAEYCSPLKMIEYLSAGRSIISSNLPSIAEVLVDGLNCLLVDSESVDEWSSAMGRLENDAGLRAHLARGAAQTASQHTIVGRLSRILQHAGAGT